MARVPFASFLYGAVLFLGCGTEAPGPNGDGGGIGNGHPDLNVSIDGGGCGLRTCASAGANCGPIGDGCGGLIDCGTCQGPQSCGGGMPGKPSVCGGTMGCVPKTCMYLHADCGPAGDGCGGLLQCGTCPAGQICGAGGKPNVCGAGVPASDGGGGGVNCIPNTCPHLGYNCGPAGDGCGGVLDCGTCPAGQTCGIGGKPSVCGLNSMMCTPQTCMQQGFNCGMAGDGCGNAINCGSNCPIGQICGGGGVPNNCGSSAGPDAGVNCVNLCKQQVACDGGTTTITGTVLAPTNSSMGYGKPDPLPGALVYIPNGTVMPFKPGVACGACGTEVTGDPLVSATSAVDGSFTLTKAPCGASIPLVIQLGRWRRHIVIPSVACCAKTQLGPDQTRFPRVQGEGNDPLNNIPLFAITTGSADAIECVLPKIGIDLGQFSAAGGNGRVRFYRDNGAQYNGGNTPPASNLWNSPAELSLYDAVILDCVGSQVDKTMQQQTNMQGYAGLLPNAAGGGRIFASHYSYVWLYNDPPWGCGNACVTPGMTTAGWQVHQADPPNLTAFIDLAFPKGSVFAAWLLLVGASTTLGEVPVMNVRHDNNSIIAPGQRWMYSDPAKSPNNPLEYTFNTPVGAPPQNQCGRVLYSDFHVYDQGGDSFPDECGKPAPMTPQEKVLEFQIFDLTSCVTPDMPVMPTCTPRTCMQQGWNCGLAGDGCGKLLNCGTCPTGQVCGLNKPNVCGGTQTCTPRTCMQQGFDCGPAGDGCGKLIQCGGPCVMGQACGGAGPGRCGAPHDGGIGCVPRTCLQQGILCGPAGDGCGNVLNCGTCPPGQTCGGGGKNSVCGGPMCTPATCAPLGPKGCGWIGDGCGGAVDCGKCKVGEVCGGCGIPNQCCSIG